VIENNNLWQPDL